jgi:multidrug efflux pump subunit AcrB
VNMSSLMQTHRRSILFFLLMLAVAGLFAAFRLPVALFPNVDFPRVVVTLDAGDRPAEQMEIQVTMLARAGRTKCAFDDQSWLGRNVSQF